MRELTSTSYVVLGTNANHKTVTRKLAASEHKTPPS